MIIKHYCSITNLEKVLSLIAQGIFIFFNCQILEKTFQDIWKLLFCFVFTIFISIWSNFCFFSLGKLEEDGDIVVLPAVRTPQPWRHRRDVTRSGCAVRSMLLRSQKRERGHRCSLVTLERCLGLFHRRKTLTAIFRRCIAEYFFPPLLKRYFKIRFN